MCKLSPYHNSGLLQVGLISGSIVLSMILHICIVLVTAAAVVTIPWVSPLSQRLKPCFCYRVFGFKYVFSRQSTVYNTRFAWAGGTFFPVVLLCQFSVLAGNRFWFYILLMYLEYHIVVGWC
jgi:hypothetical protein